MFFRSGKGQAPGDPETEDVDRPEEQRGHDASSAAGPFDGRAQRRRFLVVAGRGGGRGVRSGRRCVHVAVAVIGGQPRVLRRWQRRSWKRRGRDDAPVQTAVALRATVLPVDR